MPLLTHAFNSTAIADATYDTDTQVMQVTFTSGKTYTHEMVPEAEWDRFCAASSAGSYYGSNIRGRY